MKKLLTAALGAAAITGSLLGAAPASADLIPEVCVGIDEAPSYQAYLIDAAVWGKAFNWDERQQATNIVQSVLTYCPWHAAGIRAAARSLSSGSYVA